MKLLFDFCRNLFVVSPQYCNKDKGRSSNFRSSPPAVQIGHLNDNNVSTFSLNLSDDDALP